MFVFILSSVTSPEIGPRIITPLYICAGKPKASYVFVSADICLTPWTFLDDLTLWATERNN